MSDTNASFSLLGYFYNKEGHVYGPVSLEEIKNLFEMNVIDLQSKVFCPHKNNWYSYGELFQGKKEEITEHSINSKGKKKGITRIAYFFGELFLLVMLILSTTLTVDEGMLIFLFALGIIDVLLTRERLVNMGVENAFVYSMLILVPVVGMVIKLYALFSPTGKYTGKPFFKLLP